MLIRVFSFLFLLIPIFIWGSHNRGGEITYTHIGGLTYEFTITTCTDLGSATGTDRPELFLDFDLGTPFAQRDTLTRTSEVPLSLNHKKNIYVGNRANYERKCVLIITEQNFIEFFSIYG